MKYIILLLSLVLSGQIFSAERLTFAFSLSQENRDDLAYGLFREVGEEKKSLSLSPGRPFLIGGENDGHGLSIAVSAAEM